MKKTIIKSTDHVREREIVHQCDLVGKELKNPIPFGQAVTGFVERRFAVYGAFRNICITLDLSDVQEVESKPIHEVLMEAGRRAK